MDPSQQITDRRGVASLTMSVHHGCLEKIAVRRGQIFHHEALFPGGMAVKPDSGVRGFGDCLQPSVFRQIAFDGRGQSASTPSRKREFHAI